MDNNKSYVLNGFELKLTLGSAFLRIEALEQASTNYYSTILTTEAVIILSHPRFNDIKSLYQFLLESFQKDEEELDFYMTKDSDSSSAQLYFFAGGMPIKMEKEQVDPIEKLEKFMLTLAERVTILEVNKRKAALENQHLLQVIRDKLDNIEKRMRKNEENLSLLQAMQIAAEYNEDKQNEYHLQKQKKDSKKLDEAIQEENISSVNSSEDWRVNPNSIHSSYFRFLNLNKSLGRNDKNKCKEIGIFTTSSFPKGKTSFFSVIIEKGHSISIGVASGKRLNGTSEEVKNDSGYCAFQIDQNQIINRHLERISFLESKPAQEGSVIKVVVDLSRNNFLISFFLDRNHIYSGPIHQETVDEEELFPYFSLCNLDDSITIL